MKFPPLFLFLALLTLPASAQTSAAEITGQRFAGDNYIGGSKALLHWIIPDDKNKIKAALKAGNVDVLILTPVYLPMAVSRNLPIMACNTTRALG